MKKPINIHISWDNHLKFKDEIYPCYYSTTGVREVESMGKSVEWEIVFDDGTVEKGKEGYDPDRGYH